MSALQVKDIVRLDSERYTLWKVTEIADSYIEITERLEFGRQGRVRNTLSSKLTKVCGVLVADGGRSVGSHYCGKPIKDEELGLCGVHAGARKREHAKEVQRQADLQAGREAIQAIANELQALGVTGNVDTYSDSRFVSRPTGKVVLSLDELRRIITEFRSDGA